MLLNELIQSSKVISIKQPWAWLIVNGYKDIENRTWNTNYRGTLYIHAGKSIDKIGYERISKNFKDIVLPAYESLELGGIIGICELIDVIPPNNHSKSRWYEGNYGFIIKNAKPITFIPSKGKLGLYNLT